jgi:hypothetical protein
MEDGLMRFLTAGALAAVMFWVPVDGVAQQRNPLVGLSVIDHFVTVDWDDQIRSSEQKYTQEAERAFELGLLRAGITLDEDAATLLGCGANLFAPSTLDGNQVIHSYEVAYREIVVPVGAARTVLPSAIDAYRQFARTWGTGSVGIVGITKLSGTALGEFCAEAFELEWRRANN